MRWHFFVAFVVLLATVGAFLYQPLLKPGPPLTIRLKQGASAKTLYDFLDKSNRLKSHLFFKALLKVSSSSEHLQAGTYELTADQSPIQLLTQLENGEVLKNTFTIIPGTTFKQVVKNLKCAPFLNKTEQLDTALNAKRYEGYLMPDSYEYVADSPETLLLDKAYKAMQQALAISWQQRDKSLPYRFETELLTAASIIEKETSHHREKPLVSAVIVNRLNKHMRLQMDPTVIYALGDAYDGSIYKAQLKVDSPYNTYRYKGLPPGPIAFPALSSLRAAAHPAKVGYLYFVANKEGRHTFSKTLSEQNKAVKAYLLKQHD